MDKQNRNRTPKSLTLSKQTWNEVDSLRGLVSRSRFVEKMILDGMQTKKLRLNGLNEFPSSKQSVISGETQWKE